MEMIWITVCSFNKNSDAENVINEGKISFKGLCNIPFNKITSITLKNTLGTQTINLHIVPYHQEGQLQANCSQLIESPKLYQDVASVYP